MDNYYNICFHRTNETDEITLLNSRSELNEENVTELLNFYFPTVSKGDVKVFIQNVARAKITLDELYFFAEKIKPHLNTILTIQGDSLTQVEILDYSIKIFAGTDNTESKTDDEIRMMLNKLIGESNNHDNFSTFPEYSNKDDIGSYTISPLYSVINYINTEENKEKNEPVNIQFDNEGLNLNGDNSAVYNDVS